MSDTRTQSSPISVTGPFSPAADRTGRILFRPFDLRKWFVLGFCAWLAWLGQGSGGGSNWNLPEDDVRPDAEMAQDWVLAHLALVILLAVVLALVIVGVVILVTWLSSRGKLMFLDGVVRDRGAVVEPWRRFRALGNSLFGFRIVVGLIALVTFAVLIGLMVLSLMATGFREGDPGLGAIVVLCLWIAVLLATGFGFALVGMVVNDFIVPIMWLRDCRVTVAWSEFLPLLRAHRGTFVLYALFKILLGLGILFISCVVTCLTCCIAALPYIGTVILLPLHVFRRSYSIGFLSQFHPDYAALAPPVAAPPAAPGSTPPETPA